MNIKYSYITKKVLNQCTLKGPSVPHKLPRKNLVRRAIQKFTLTPNSAVNMTLKRLTKIMI